LRPRQDCRVCIKKPQEESWRDASVTRPQREREHSGRGWRSSSGEARGCWPSPAYRLFLQSKVAIILCGPCCRYTVYVDFQLCKRRAFLCKLGFLANLPATAGSGAEHKPARQRSPRHGGREQRDRTALPTSPIPGKINHREALHPRVINRSCGCAVHIVFGPWSSRALRRCFAPTVGRRSGSRRRRSRTSSRWGRPTFSSARSDETQAEVSTGRRRSDVLYRPHR